MGSRVTVRDGVTGLTLQDYHAFPIEIPTGLYVASGDVNNDGHADVIVGAGSGFGWMRVFSGRDAALLREWTAFDGLLATGARAAASDVNADGYVDVIAGGGPGGTPTVQVFDGASGALVTTFSAYTDLFGGGVFVAGADVNGDGYGDIITGADAGGGPHVRVWDGRTFTELMGFYAFDPAFTGGVRVAGLDLNRDGKAEIITGAGPGSTPTVRVFDGATGALLSNFLAADSVFAGGVFVAGVLPTGRMNIDLPPAMSTVSTTFTVAGWAFDNAALSGVGVDAIHVWAHRASDGAATFLGTATLGGDRADVAGVFGDQWRYSGFSLAATLTPGVYDVVVFVHSSVSNTFNNRRVVRITVQ